MRNKAKRPVGRPSRKPDSDMLEIMMEKYTAAEIARMFGVPSSTVRSWKCRDIRKGEIVNGKNSRK